MYPDVYNLGKKAQEEAPKRIQELYGGKNIRVIFMNLTLEDVNYYTPEQLAKKQKEEALKQQSKPKIIQKKQA